MKLTIFYFELLVDPVESPRMADRNGNVTNRSSVRACMSAGSNSLVVSIDPNAPGFEPWVPNRRSLSRLTYLCLAVEHRQAVVIPRDCLAVRKLAGASESIKICMKPV
ncbi:uncharacterized protein PHALS_04592 [Plasmopara halstedii]|uniref:Uncharacterized protein n=1 Tax=Plasmopara halstedii TaxID=4781 RepID=A0A0P1AAG7_PLAHL|nr:uncharacterized protein PHALS_04592 [Plasmopara halstedii]CEG37140.1 hypothetical protein PHALS_04592 [Plasmopara halstedii]|eukprot:XP_024573509.1 hypothetical protein PHALS_04592 [Plasmopara halstedii]